MLPYLTNVIILAFIVLAAQVLKKPGIAAGLVWAMLAMEQVLMQGNAFLLDRSAFINISVALIAAVSAAAAFFSGSYRDIKIPKQLWVYTALLALCVISYTWSESPSETRRHLLKNLPYILTFVYLAPLCLFSEKQLNSAINVTIYFVALIVLGLSISEIGRRGVVLTVERTGELVEANPLAAASFAGYVAIACLFSTFGKRLASLASIAKLGILAVALYAMAKSGSRGQLIGFAAVAIFWFPVIARVSLKRSTIIAMIGAFAATATGIYIVENMGFNTRWQLDQFAEAQQGRVEMAMTMLEICFRDGPRAWLVGLGSSASFKYLETYPHNIYAETLAEEGLVGFTLLITVILMTLKQGYALLRTEGLSPGVRVNIGILMGMYCFNLILGLKQGSLLGAGPSVFCTAMAVGWLHSRIDTLIAQHSRAMSMRFQLQRMQQQQRRAQIPLRRI
jgi:O-antigen ligase